jgi:hypothetical protein
MVKRSGSRSEKRELRGFFGVKDCAWRDGYQKGIRSKWLLIIGSLLVLGLLGTNGLAVCGGAIIGGSVVWKTGLWRTEEF